MKAWWAVVGVVLALWAPSHAGAVPAPSPRPIAFMTDFDVRDDAVAICKAVMEGVAPGVRILDISHQVTPYDIAEGARFLAGTTPYLAPDAVVVAVVDPGVGSRRRALIAKSGRGQVFVLPDNGLLTLVQDRDGIVAAREITNPAWMIGAKRSSTFHGRDIFSPAAGHVARGEDWTAAGPAVDIKTLVRLDLKPAVIDAQGAAIAVIGTDGPYGNLVLNMPAEDFARLGWRLGDVVPFSLDGRAMRAPFVKTFSDVPEGAPLLYIDSRGRLSLGLNQRNFAETYKAGRGSTLTIPRRP